MRKRFFLLPVLVITGILFFRSKENCQAFGSHCVTPTVESVSQISPHYYWYTQQNLEASLKNHEKVVLFFYAPWCGTCSTLDEELIQHSERLAPGITVLKVQYDKDSYMKKKYGVVVQHTLVLLDDSGNEVSKWVGGDIRELNGKIH